MPQLRYGAYVLSVLSTTSPSVIGTPNGDSLYVWYSTDHFNEVPSSPTGHVTIEEDDTLTPHQGVLYLRINKEATEITYGFYSSSGPVVKSVPTNADHPVPREFFDELTKQIKDNPPVQYDPLNELLSFTEEPGNPENLSLDNFVRMRKEADRSLLMLFKHREFFRRYLATYSSDSDLLN